MVSQAAKYAAYALGPFVLYIGHVFLIHSNIVRVDPSYAIHVYALPLYAVVAFGLYSIAVVLCGVATFKDCGADSDALKEEIVEARADLRRRGLKDQ